MKTLLTAGLALILLICGGCSGSGGRWPDILRSGPWWRSTQVGGIVERAREWESRDELDLALNHWRLVERIAVDPTEARGEIQRLENRIAEAVQMHYQKGLAALKHKRPLAARNRFLSALRLDPAFEPALRQIQSRYATFPLTVYPAAPGDTPASIAQKVFDDRNKAFLVAWFNHLPPDRELAPGALVLLPKLDHQPEASVPGIHPPDRLAEARERLAVNDFEAALALAGPEDAADPGALKLIHEIRLKKAAAQIAAGDLEAAEATLAAIPAAFAGKAKAQEGLQQALRQRRFDLALADARDLFEKGNFASSLERSEDLLQQAPDNREAHRLATESRYHMAKNLFDQGSYLKAREVLAGADGAHEASAALKIAVNDRLVQVAQTHYRSGVKHFINEHLEAAIAEWEKALECDPDHAKARENIAIARRLLQKIETMP